MVTITVINLKKEFGDRFIVRKDRSFESRKDPWGWYIPGARGDVCPFGNLSAFRPDHGIEMLMCSMKRRYKRDEDMISQIPYSIIWQNGDDGINFIFPPESIDEVHKYVKLRVRKKFSEGHREKLREGIKNARSSKKGQD